MRPWLCEFKRRQKGEGEEGTSEGLCAAVEYWGGGVGRPLLYASKCLLATAVMSSQKALTPFSCVGRLAGQRPV